MPSRELRYASRHVPLSGIGGPAHTGRPTGTVTAAARRTLLVCDGAELAVEVAGATGAIGVEVEPRVSADPVSEAIEAMRTGQPVALALSSAPPAEALVRLATAARAQGIRALAAVVGPADDASSTLALLGDLGVVAVDEARPLASALALMEADAKRPWAASTRHLPEVDRVRLASVVGGSERGGGRLVREDDGQLGWGQGDTVVRVGEPRDVALAIGALHAASGPVAKSSRILQGVEREAVSEVLFGPPRPLSDPASKAALAPYGIPVPVEELCTSPSRAAAEAGRIGFPVRIALASPDLRVWDHPDLAVDGVDNAARVRDVFRQMMTLAGSRAPSARLLGVTVTATSAARALLRLSLRPLPEGLVLASVGFADPHGIAAGDHTHTVLPAPLGRIERVLERLAAGELLLSGPAPLRRQSVQALGDVLLRLAAFVDDHRGEVDAVEVDPMAVLVGGGVEVREACVHVGDAFVRSLEATAAGGSAGG